jgi:hypothetical protein
MIAREAPRNLSKRIGLTVSVAESIFLQRILFEKQSVLLTDVSTVTGGRFSRSIALAPGWASRWWLAVTCSESCRWGQRCHPSLHLNIFAWQNRWLFPLQSLFKMHALTSGLKSMPQNLSCACANNSEPRAESRNKSWGADFLVGI